MKVAALLSVVSGSVVAVALSSAAVQVQPTSVLVSRPQPQLLQAAPAAPQALPAAGAARAAARVAAPARPSYVDLPARSSAVVLRSGTARQGSTAVDVLACSTSWSAAGECLGTQTEVLRGAVLGAGGTALSVPHGAHVRVSTGGGDVVVEAGRSDVDGVRGPAPTLP